MQHLMAGSDIRSYNQITDKENIWVSGYSLPSTSTGDTNGNVDDMSKSNSLDMWDDEEE